MSGYLFFTAKSPEVNALLDRINGAGRSQHNTSEWQTPEDWYSPEGEPPCSLNERIQDAVDTLDETFIALKAASEWQDIETAPRDGTFVLALEDDDIYKARWQSEGYWSAWCGQPVVHSPGPTHWQPLPSKPQQE